MPQTTKIAPASSSQARTLNNQVAPKVEKQLPLPLTAFEEYLWIDDRPEYPMSFFLELQLSGNLQRDEFEESLQIALNRHPLLTSLIKPGLLHGGKWHASAIPPQHKWFDDEQLPDTNDSQWIDLREEPGFRSWVSHKQESSRVILQFHHAATDGTGAIQFVGDLLALYGQRTCSPEQKRPELPELNRNALLHRGKANPMKLSLLKIIRGIIRQTHQMIFDEPTTLATAKPSNATDSNSLPASPLNHFPPFVSRVIDAETVKEIKKRALRCGVSENDLYTTAMFYTIQQWNKQQGCTEKKKPFCIGIPVSLRTPEHDNISASNVLSYNMLYVDNELLKDSQRVLNEVHEQINHALNSVDRGMFTMRIDSVRRIPGILKLITKSSRCFSTVILTNVGQVRRLLRAKFPVKRGKCIAGNVTLESLMGATPIRPHTRMATSLGTYSEKLFINMNCDPTLFSSQEAEQLIDLFVTNVKSQQAEKI